MDVTPQVLHDVEFRSKVRGYDPDEVDDFLERVAVGVSQLHAKLKEATDRAEAAEARAADLEARPPSSDADETLKRTLVLAQRTADAAIKEAEEQAAKTVGDAQEEADRLVGDAETTAARLREDAEADARRTADESRQRLVEEITGLEATRDAVQSDVGALDQHHQAQVARLRSAIGDFQRLLDDPEALRETPLPELSGAALPSHLRPGAAEADERAAAEEHAAPDEAAGDDEELEAIDDEEIEPVEAGGDGGAGEGEQAEPALALVDDDDGLGDEDRAGDFADDDLDDDGPFAADLDDDLNAPVLAFPEHDDDQGDEVIPVAVEDLPPMPPPPPPPPGSTGRRRRGVVDSGDDLGGPPTEAVEIPEGPEGDDAYLAELRKATMAAPDEDDLPPLPPMPEDRDAPKFRSRFGRKR
jgi:cell division initiation protein